MHVVIPPGADILTEEMLEGLCAGGGPGAIDSLSLPEGLDEIGDNAFADCTALTAVVLPRSLKKLGRWAFYGCTGLESVTMPEDGLLEEIGDGAFGGCTALTAVVLPRSLKKLGRCAFYGCTGLESVTMPEDGLLEEIGDGAFGGCTALTAVMLPRSLKKLGRCAFYGCTGLESVTMPGGGQLEGVGDEPFDGCTALKIIDFGQVADLAVPSRFPTLNGFPRTATVRHRLAAAPALVQPGSNTGGHRPDDDEQFDAAAADVDSCVAQRTWPASTQQLNEGELDEYGREAPPTHAGTEPGPIEAVLDATGIVSPAPLQDLSGDEFLVYGCWPGGPGAGPRALAIAQHPAELGDREQPWGVQAGAEAEVATHNPDLDAVAPRLANRELSLEAPWLLVWNPEHDDGEGGEKGEVEAGAAPGAAGGDDGDDGSGRRVRRGLAGAG